MDVSLVNKPETVRVVLGTLCPDALLEIRGRYQICDPYTHLEISSGVFSARHPLEATPEGIRWGKRLPSFFHIRFVPVDADTSLIFNGVQYRGCLEVHQESGLLHIVNEVDVESYLKASLPLKCAELKHPAVCEALAIVARTHAYAFARTGRFVDARYYRGCGTALGNSALEKAIDSTRHRVLTYKGSVFEALFTQNSAGRTACFSHIFRKLGDSPSGVSIPALTKQRQGHSWSFTVRRQDLARVVNLSTLTAVDAFQDRFSGRVYALRMKEGSFFQDVDFFTFQKAVGETLLKSNDFSITAQGDKITFMGYGEGHGVGLCIHSAEILAQQGFSTSKILTTFFPETEIKNIRP